MFYKHLISIESVPSRIITSPTPELVPTCVLVTISFNFFGNGNFLNCVDNLIFVKRPRFFLLFSNNIFNELVCGKTLRNDSCLRRHMMGVHGIKQTCGVCGKDFSSKSGLQHHQRDFHGIHF